MQKRDLDLDFPPVIRHFHDQTYCDETEVLLNTERALRSVVEDSAAGLRTRQRATEGLQEIQRRQETIAELMRPRDQATRVELSEPQTLKGDTP